MVFTGCSIAPITPQVNARTLPKGQVGTTSWVSLFPSMQVAYGVTNKFDIGIDSEQFTKISLWSKYNLINGEFLALAGIAGVFKGPSANKARGYFAGIIMNRELNEKLSFFSHYRFTDSTYLPIDDDDTLIGDDDFGVDANDSDDLSNTSQLNLGFTVHFTSRIRLNLGYGCQYHHRNNDPDTTTSPCIPLIGFSAGKR